MEQDGTKAGIPSEVPASTLYLFILVLGVSLATFVCTVLGNVCSQKIMSYGFTRECSHRTPVCCVGHTYASGNHRPPEVPHQNQKGQAFNWQRNPLRPSAPMPGVNYATKYEEAPSDRRDPRRTDSGIFRRLGIREGSASVLQPLARQLENENLSPMHHTPPEQRENRGMPQSPNPPPAKVHRLAQHNEGRYRNSRSNGSNYFIANQNYNSGIVRGEAQVHSAGSDFAKSFPTLGDLPSEAVDEDQEVEDGMDEDARSQQSDNAEKEPLLLSNSADQSEGRRITVRNLGDPGATSPKPVMPTYFLTPAPPLELDNESIGDVRQPPSYRLREYPIDTGTILTHLNPSVRRKSDQFYCSSVCTKCGQNVDPPTMNPDTGFLTRVERNGDPRLSVFNDSVFRLKPKKTNQMSDRKMQYLEAEAKVSSPQKEFVDHNYRLAVPEPAPSSTTTEVRNSNLTSLPSTMWDHEGMKN